MKRTKQQILAEIRNIKTNKNNYIETTIRADPYSLVATRMLEKIPHSTIFDGMSFKQVRSFCKKPVMTTMYNSRLQPLEAFGEDTEELHAFYDTLQELFPGAMNVLKALNDRWDNTTMFHEWALPDGHVAHVKVTQHIDGIIEQEGLNLPYRYEKNMPSNVKTSLAPNVVHSLDAFVIRYVVENADFQVSHIHDELQAHPNNMSKLRELYKEALKVIAEGNYLEEFCEKDFSINTTKLVKGLEKSSYALC